MKIRKDDYIPLFLHVEDPIATFIIDNEFIGCMHAGGRERWPNKAFTILRQLYEATITRSQLPERFREHFTDTEEIHSKKPYHCLIGEDFAPQGIECFLCLTVNVEVRENKGLHVLLSNFKLDEEPLNYRFSLSAKEAFFIFSNICSNTRCASYEAILDKARIKIFNKSIIEKNSRDLYQHATSLSPIDHFVLDYIDNLQEKLFSQLIAPYEILRASGARLLVLLAGLKPVSRFIDETLEQIRNFNNLSINEAAMYYTFLKSLRTFKRKEFPNVEQFIKNDDSLITYLEDKIIKYF